MTYGDCCEDVIAARGAGAFERATLGRSAHCPPELDCSGRIDSVPTAPCSSTEWSGRT